MDTPKLTPDNAKDWRSPSGVRVRAYTGDLAYFDGKVTVDRYKVRQASLRIQPDGKHLYSDFRLVYDPLPKTRPASWAVFSFDTKSGFNFTPQARDTFTDEHAANQRAERLAQIHPGFEFVVARIQLVKRVPVETVPPTETVLYA